MSKQEFEKSFLPPSRSLESNTSQLQSRSFSHTPYPSGEYEAATPKITDSAEQKSSFSFDRVDVSTVSVSPSSTATPLQAKLTIGQPGDKYEQEADRVATQVVQHINSPHIAQQEEKIRRSPVNPSASLPIQRQSLVQVGSEGSELKSRLDRTRNKEDRSAPQPIQAKASTTDKNPFLKQGGYQPVVSTMKAPKLLQRVTEMGEQDWSSKSAAKFMMEKQVNQNNSPNLDKQNKANASIWYNTLFSPGKDTDATDRNEAQEKVLQEQQALLKRHFLAQAVFGVQGGTQFKKGKTKIIGSNKPDINENYEPIENFKKDQTSANLATLASGGGRFNYRSEDDSGDAFNQFLLFGDSTDKRDLSTVRANSRNQMPTSHLGAYKRISTHGESFDDNHIREVDKTTGGIDATGFDIPIGGIGQKLRDSKGREVTTGYQGISSAKHRNPSKLTSSNTTSFQTGSGLHRHAKAKDGSGRSLTQIAFEGSAPHQNNIHGGSHGIAATIGKKIFGGQSAKTLTGQDKRSKLGLPGGIGSIKADVTKGKLKDLEEYYTVLERFRTSEDPENQEIERVTYQKLLASTTQEEREEILSDLIKKTG